ncbi:unnamed protein product, partial [Durusdinium trenchii]
MARAWPKTSRRMAFAAVSAATASLAAASLVTAPRPRAVVPLLGGSAAWHFQSWRAITDQVRGGVSTARLVAAESGDDPRARFEGTLDPSKLNAGFAGVNLDVSLLPEKISELSGLQVDVFETDGREYSLLVKLKGAESGSSYQV